MTPYNTFIAKSRYSRYLDDKGRREHWNETVARYFDFMEKHLSEKHHAGQLQEAGNQHERRMKQQESIQRNLQAVMAARQTKPTKGE